MNTTDLQPKLATSFTINFIAMIIGITALIIARLCDYHNYTNLFILYAIIITVATAIMEYFSKKISTPLKTWHIQRKFSWIRILYKEVTLLFTFGCIGLIYFLFFMFNSGDFVLYFFPFLKIILPYICLGSIPYFILMDKIEDEPHDIYYKIGYSILHFKKTTTKFELCNYARSWLVKAFWLGLMESGMIYKIQWLITYDWNIMKGQPIEWFWTANVICFFIDLTYASLGYLMNFKLIGTDTKTAEPTFLGWTVAIICYWPFWGVLFYPYFFNYNANQTWLSVFETSSFGWWFWFIAIIGLELIYSLATVAAGIRFSNLTYRGLWKTGPYRWTKHPAYVMKNISWWLISMPFMAAGLEEAIRTSLLLFGVNIIYYLRAKTEEHHLSHYPEYVAYALEMNEKSIFRGIAKLLPFLKYRPLTEKEKLF